MDTAVFDMPIDSSPVYFQQSCSVGNCQKCMMILATRTPDFSCRKTDRYWCALDAKSGNRRPYPPVRLKWLERAVAENGETSLGATSTTTNTTRILSPAH